MKKLRIMMMGLALILAMTTAHAQGRDAKNVRQTVVLGAPVQHDTTRHSKRSLKSFVIAPKGEWQLGATIAYMDVSAKDSEFLLLLNDTDAGASVLRLAPNVAYTYKDNQSVGLRFQYTSANAVVDAATLDLLGNYKTEVGDIHARTRSYGGHVYNRSYLGLDNRGRIGLFMDASLGYTRSKTVAYMGDPSDAYVLNDKLSLNFSPGVIYFPMNTVSVYVALSLADVSYNHSVAYSDGQVSGTRNFFRAQTKLNLLALNFGLSIHL